MGHSIFAIKERPSSLFVQERFMLASNLNETSVFGRHVSSMSVLSARAIVGDEAGTFREIVSRFTIFDFIDSDSTTAIVNLDFHQS